MNQKDRKKNNIINNYFIVKNARKRCCNDVKYNQIMFEIHFSFSSIIFMNDIKRFIYSSSTNNDETMIRREIIKIVYKINFNKMLKINEIINKALQQLAQVIIK